MENGGMNEKDSIIRPAIKPHHPQIAAARQLHIERHSNKINSIMLLVFMNANPDQAN
jgi:hypothetical protein